ncbi:MAG TPA: hypothetical protein VFA32_01125, partial [Dehalococcoidia bacterium]|nr:hypothetical protein [Dehalococcoidia bacterium]
MDFCRAALPSPNRDPQANHQWLLVGRLEMRMAGQDWFNQGIGQRCRLKATTASYSSERRKIIASVSTVAPPGFRLPR